MFPLSPPLSLFPFTQSTTAKLVSDPCQPSPCGPNSRCRVFNQNAVCSCIEGFIGNPPTCRPECVRNSDCGPQKACQNQKCVDPCPGACGFNAICNVVNHAPICTCPTRHTGNPFVACQPISKYSQNSSHVTVSCYKSPLLPVEPPPRLEEPKDPCYPSPCGPNSACRAVGDAPSCSCLPQFTGSPPNCRPECVTNSECSHEKACINQKCVDPCPGLCGQNAQCRVISHTAMCLCVPGYTGDPFTFCSATPAQQEEVIRPCEPNPCGVNAECRQGNNAGSCQCLPEYFGNPYEGCRPECVTNSDCPLDKSCQNQKCRDPCPGVCALNAQCRVINHLPSCNCLDGFVGDPYSYCQLPEKRELTCTLCTRENTGK